MKKTILLTLFALSCMVFAQESGPPQLTPLTREFNRATTAAAARGVIGAASSGSGGALTNAVIYGSTSGSVTFGATANATFSGGKTITTDTGALSLTTGAANGNISLTPHGTGYTLLNGNVGIGTATPATKLAVAGTAVFSLDGLTTSGGLMVTEETTYSRIQSFNGEPLAINSLGNSVGIGTTAPDKALEINSATGANLRLTYNDSSGSAANYADFSMSSGGNLTIAPSGGSISNSGTTASTSTTTGSLINAGGFGNAGNITFGGYLAGSVQSLSGAGAVNVTTAITEVTTTGVGNALTLANGVAGQEKTIIHGVDGGSFVLTPTTKTGWTTFTSTVVGESISLVYLTTRGWIVKGSYLGVIAP